jgi:hypothetical protein
MSSVLVRLVGIFPVHAFIMYYSYISYYNIITYNIIVVVVVVVAVGEFSPCCWVFSQTLSHMLLCAS